MTKHFQVSIFETTGISLKTGSGLGVGDGGELPTGRPK